MSVQDKIKQQVAAAAAEVDMSKPSAGGGDYTPPPHGLARARFVGYFELGAHMVPDFNDKSKMKKQHQVRLVFELSGEKYPKSENGTPIRISVDEAYEPGKAPGEKSNFYKIFNKMNYKGTATHIAELLGEAFLVTIYHSKSADGKRTFAGMKGSAKTEPKGEGYNITGPSIYDPIAEKNIPVPIDPPVTEIKAYFWNSADLEDFDSLFIDGKYEAVKNEKGEVVKPERSKNVLQEKIMEAVNFGATPVAALLKARKGGNPDPKIDTPEATKPERSSEQEGDDPIPF